MLSGASLTAERGADSLTLIKNKISSEVHDSGAERRSPSHKGYHAW